MLGDFDAALENELDIKYIQGLLEKQGIIFSSQEFQFNTVYGETLLRKGMTEEAERVQKIAFENESISSKTDLFFGYVSKTEVDIALGKYDEALKDCKSALKIMLGNSNKFLLKKCKCLYLKSVANEKTDNLEESKKSLKEFWEVAKKLNEGLKKIDVQKLFIEEKVCDHMKNCLQVTETFLKEMCEIR